MKTFSSDLIAALEAGEVMQVGAVKIATADPFRVWGGFHTLTLDGEAYTGIGATGLVQVTSGQLGSAEQSIELAMTLLDPTVLGLVDLAGVRGASAVIWRLFFDTTGTQLLGAHKYAAGRVDSLPMDETSGGEATLRAKIKTAAAGQGRLTGAMRSDAAQRALDANDGAFKRVTAAPLKTIAWGGKPPNRAGGTLPNTNGGGSSVRLDLGSVNIA